MDQSEIEIEGDADDVRFMFRQSLPGRHALSPHTKETDDVIVKFVSNFGNRWVSISRLLGGSARGFSVDTVRMRASRILGGPEKPRPRVTRSKTKVRMWSREDDQELVDFVANEPPQHKRGRSWGKIAKRLGRTPHACRNRYTRLFPESVSPRAEPSPEAQRGSPFEWM